MQIQEESRRVVLTHPITLALNQREGMWTRCFPAMKTLKQVLSTNEIGHVVYVQGDFGYTAPSDSDERFWLPNSGGITMDVGMYIAQFGRLVFPGGRVRNIHASGVAKDGVDYSAMASVMYERGEGEKSRGVVDDGMMSFVLTGAANTEERVMIQGTKGRIIVEGPFHIPQLLRVMYDEGRGQSKVVVHEFPLPDDPYNEEWNNPDSIGFIHQINEVGEALREGKTQCESYTWEDSLEVAKIVDEIVLQVRGKRDCVK